METDGEGRQPVMPKRIVGPAGIAPTYGLKLYNPHGHIFEMSIREVP